MPMKIKFQSRGIRSDNAVVLITSRIYDQTSRCFNPVESGLIMLSTRDDDDEYSNLKEFQSRGIRSDNAVPCKISGVPIR